MKKLLTLFACHIFFVQFLSASPFKNEEVKNRELILSSLEQNVHFQKFCFNSYKLATGLKSKADAAVCAKYLRKQATEDEKKQLAGQLGLLNVEELTNFFSELFISERNFLNEIPELKKETKPEEIIKEAAANTAIKLEFSKKLSLKAYNNCWLILSGSSGDCWLACGGFDDQECWEACYLIHLDAYTLCMLWQD